MRVTVMLLLATFATLSLCRQPPDAGPDAARARTTLVDRPACANRDFIPLGQLVQTHHGHDASAHPPHTNPTLPRPSAPLPRLVLCLPFCHF